MVVEEHGSVNFILTSVECVFSPLSRSVPSFHGLQEDILSKLADVLEEVNARASRPFTRLRISIPPLSSITARGGCHRG